MINKKRIKLIINSAQLLKTGSRYVLSLSQPIQDVINVSIKQVVIKDFIGSAAYNFFTLRSDIGSMCRQMNYFNNTPSSVVALIPNIASGKYYSNMIADSNPLKPFDLYTTWFEIWGDGLTLLSPADPGWNFSIEIDLTTENEFKVGN